MANKRGIVDGVQPQGEDEFVTYALTVSPAPESIIGVTVWDEKTEEDVTAEVMPSGEASFLGSVITFPPLRNLTAGRMYRVEVLYSDGTNRIEPFFLVMCER